MVIRPMKRTRGQRQWAGTAVWVPRKGEGALLKAEVLLSLETPLQADRKA